MPASYEAKQHQKSESTGSKQQSNTSNDATAKDSSQQPQRSNLLEKFKKQMPRPRSRSPNPAAVNTKCTNMTDPKPAQVERKPSSPTSPTSTHPKPPTKRHSSGTFNDCGRHSNDWLFNGFSVTEAAKGLLKRRDS